MEFEEETLETTVRLGKPTSAREIREDLEKCLDRKISIGVLYSTLERLENRGLILHEIRLVKEKEKYYFYPTREGLDRNREYRRQHRIFSKIPSLSLS